MDLTHLDASRCLNDDQLLDLALEIFMQLANENLSPQAIQLFNQQFNQHGRLAIYQAGDDWLDNEIDFDPSQSEFFADVVIGLVDKQQQFTTQFARLLLCRDSDYPLCHIRWQA